MPTYPIKAKTFDGFLVAVADENLPRAKALVHSLVQHFKARGHRFVKGKYKGRKKIIVNGSNCEFIIRERFTLERSRSHGGRFGTTGELQVRGRVDGSLCLWWMDTEQTRLEEQVGDIVPKFEARIKESKFEASMRGKGTSINNLLMATPLAPEKERDIEFLVKVWDRLPTGVRAGIVQIAKAHDRL